MLSLWFAAPAAAFGIAGSLLGYLASPQQQWLRRGPWPTRRRYWPATLCLLASLVLFLCCMGSGAAAFTWLTVVMLLGSAAPFLGAWRAQSRRRTT